MTKLIRLLDDASAIGRLVEAEKQTVSMTNELRRVGKFWSQSEPGQDGGNFYTSPLLRRYIIENAYGMGMADEHQDNIYFAEDILAREYLEGKKVETVLSLCCGFGSVERRLVSQLPTIRRCLGVDIAVGALDRSRERAVEQGMDFISYQYADLNSWSWADEEYDLVVANGALHHLRNLEGVLEGVRRSLKPNGVFYACEYVGPSYQDHSVRQLQIINAAAFLVPPELRGRRGLPYFGHNRSFRFASRLYSIAARQENPDWPGWKKIVALAVKRLLRQDEDHLDFGVVHISPKETIRKTDPSECVRSSDIIPLAKDCFPGMEVRPLGGGILQHALDGAFYKDFDSNNPLHTRSLEALCYLERHFMGTGEIGMENAILIATK